MDERGNLKRKREDSSSSSSSDTIIYASSSSDKSFYSSSSFDSSSSNSNSADNLSDSSNLEFDEIREEEIIKPDEKKGQNLPKKVLCDFCMLKSVPPYNLAVYLCFSCVNYFCVECFRGHDNSHRFYSVESEQSVRERRRRGLLRRLRRERTRKDELETENVSVCDRVSVEHQLDQFSCAINGLCGLNNRRWVACDCSNHCIKIFQCGSNVLLRYIRIGSKPGDVTEIQVKQNSTVPDSASSSSSDISGTDSTKPDKQNLLAVTLPWKRHILFIDVNKNPAVKVKSISIEKQCYRIEYSGDKIFTLCKEQPSSSVLWSVYVMSTNDVKLSVIQKGIVGTGLAVLPGRVYVTDWDSKVKCINVEGRDLSEITMEGLQPDWISVDPNNNVYVGAGSDYNVYKLDMDLTEQPRPLLDSSTLDIDNPEALCFYRDKLFFGFNNFVAVIRLV